MRTIEEMRRGDATVHAGLMAVKMPIVAAEWSVESGGEDEQDTAAAELIDYNFNQVLNWKAVLTEALTMLDFGFSVFELVFDWANVNGVDRVVLVKIAYRKQTTIEKWTQEDGTPGIVQRKADGTAVSIPDDKLLVLTHQQEGDNWQGVSILRSAYQNWYYKKTFYQIDAVKHERQALGVVKIKYPKGATPVMREEAKAAAQNVRANERAYIEEPDGWDINFMDMMASTTADPKESISHHDRQILKNMAVQYIDIGSAGSSGSYSASTDQRRLLELQDQAIASQIAARINDKVVKAIVDMNFNVTDYPKWKVGQIGQENVQELTEAVAKMTSSKLLTPTDQDEEHVRKVLRFPDMPEDIKDLPREQVKPESKVEPEQPEKTDIKEEEPATKQLEASTKSKVRQINAQVSARDFPGLHEGLGIETDKLGCIMLDTETVDVLKHVEGGESDLVESTTEHDHAMGAVAETEPHVTLLFGLLKNGNVWKDEVDTVLDGWKMDTVTISEVGFFDLKDKFAIVAHIETTPELLDGHDRLTLLPHVQTFSEYKPHMTLAYVAYDQAIADKWVDALGAQYNGATLKAKGVNYGDLPTDDEDTDKKIEASLISTARKFKDAVMDKLYGSRNAA
ncbi:MULTISPECIES: DUF935 family protein [Rhodococcus]|uniref:phage portal protein family protein n=1 Tax=Rhodococcus TaxID=1827 RepID=UPI002235E7CB|nr:MULTISPECIES: DUF935 family protein [Rhodococcus]